MRSPAEIAFRLRQEAANVLLWLHPPSPAFTPPPSLAHLPDPRGVADSLSNTEYRERIRVIAEQILTRRLPLLGFEISTGDDLRWRQDYSTGIETPPSYFRRIPYLDVTRTGDHKVVWELNRHQHLTLLAQEFLFSREHRFIDEIVTQLESWWRENPFQRGINWTSALEVAFRAQSWMWIWRFAGDALPARFRERFMTGLYRHGLHLEYNLSVYFSPNTHLLGEALCLYTIGRLFPAFPRARRWMRVGGSIVEREMHRQVRKDGSHFEQSAYYHVYATDMFLFYAILANPGGAFRARLGDMAEYLDRLIGASGLPPMIGDDDGGRFFHPYSPRDRYARETLAACGAYLNRNEWIGDRRDTHAMAAWWLGADCIQGPAGIPGPRSSRCFADAGIVALAAENNQVIFDAGPFGPGNAGHSHADALSIVVRRAGEEILIDPGTFTYVADPAWRDRFRGTAMHNTIRIDETDQAATAGPFAWRTRPRVQLLEFTPGDEEDVAAAECSYGDFTHRRRLVFRKPHLLYIIDEIQGPPGPHRIEQFWHPGCPAVPVSPRCVGIGKFTTLSFEPHLIAELTDGGDFGWRSPALGAKQSAPLIRAALQCDLPVKLTAVLNLSAY